VPHDDHWHCPEGVEEPSEPPTPTTSDPPLFTGGAGKMGILGLESVVLAAVVAGLGLVL
jgi:hypothetical protein